MAYGTTGTEENKTLNKKFDEHTKVIENKIQADKINPQN